MNHEARKARKKSAHWDNSPYCVVFSVGIIRSHEMPVAGRDERPRSFGKRLAWGDGQARYAGKRITQAAKPPRGEEMGINHRDKRAQRVGDGNVSTRSIRARR